MGQPPEEIKTISYSEIAQKLAQWSMSLATVETAEQGKQFLEMSADSIDEFLVMEKNGKITL